MAKVKSNETKIMTALLQKQPEAKFNAIWFLKNPQTGSLHGPYTGEAVKQAMISKEVFDHFLVWDPRSPKEWSSFQSFPELLKMFGEVAQTHTPTATAEVQSVVWFIHTAGGTNGPYSMQQIHDMAKGKKISPPLFCWKDGLKEWVVYSKVDGLQNLFQDAPGAKSNQGRKALRMPFLASLELCDGKRSYLGVIRNISVSGVQVLGKPSPGPLGSEHSIVIVPNPVYGLSAMETKVVVVRILKERVGFCCRFATLPRELVHYLEAQETRRK